MKQDVVLFIEDELALAEIVRESLADRGFQINHAKTLSEANRLYFQAKPDIIVADIMLPDGDGFEFVKQIRKADLETPVIFLTSRSRPEDVVAGFETGGNDYLKKPFSMAELIVRMKALLNKNNLNRNKQTPLKNSFKLGSFTFYYPSGLLERNEIKRQLTSREADLLYMLLTNSNAYISRDELLNKLWGSTDYFSSRSLDVFISKLRKYLKTEPQLMIINVRGKGYKFVME
ncbi:MAG: response regulator transcription factor [Arachidicoccus sp.]|nr:response regulator transcription factor [Arachidicoccus sp.]